MKEQTLSNYEFKTPEVKRAAELLIDLYIALMQRREKKNERKRKPSS